MRMASQNGHAAYNSIQGVIDLRTFLGPFTRFHVRVDEATLLTADVPSQQARGYDIGQEVKCSHSLPESLPGSSLEDQRIRARKRSELLRLQSPESNQAYQGKEPMGPIQLVVFDLAGNHHRR